MDRQEAIQIIKKNWPNGRHMLSEALEFLIPELKESEDEKMIKSFKRLINAFHPVNFPTPEGFEREDMIAWLEKQVQKLILSEESRGNLLEVKCIIDEVWHNQSIREKISRSCEELESLWHWLDNIWQRVEYSKTQNLSDEQKSIDKVEPKFKVGDWVVQGCKILKIKCAGDTYYCFETSNGYVNDILVSELDSQSHLWTIKDAKEGDVLTDSNHPCIFKSINEENVLLAYCGINDKGNFATESESEDNVWDDNPEKYSPATKEQHDLLFQKMKEAGYEWDAEKKELKKIELKPAWSEDDERYYNSALWHIKNSCSNGRITSGEGEVYHWLKSLKEIIKGK